MPKERGGIGKEMRSFDFVKGICIPKVMQQSPGFLFQRVAGCNH